MRSRRNLGQTSSLYLTLTAESFFTDEHTNILKGSEGKASAEFFALFGDILSDRSILADDQRFIDQVCRPILLAGTEDGIAWMAEVAEPMLRCLPIVVIRLLLAISWTGFDKASTILQKMTRHSHT